MGSRAVSYFYGHEFSLELIASATNSGQLTRGAIPRHVHHFVPGAAL
jgi:hypothetical protein